MPTNYASDAMMQDANTYQGGEYNQPQQQPGQKPPAPLSDISPMPGQPVAEEVPHEAGGLQPGNRRSIKEYLAEIRELREQQRMAGVPEDQLPVPTFTNIEGGQMDTAQGELLPESGMGPGQQVQSYVQPEYVQGAGGEGDLSRGPEHPVSQAERATFQKSAAEFEKIKSITNPIDPRRPMAVASQLFQEAYKQEEQNKAARGEGPMTPEDSDRIANALKTQAFEQQGEYISQMKKKFPDADVAALWKAHETGNWAYAASAGQNLLSQDKLNAVTEGAYKQWNDHVGDQKNMGQKPLNQETGAPYGSLSEYVNDAVTEYQEMVSGLMEVAAEMSGLGDKGGAAKAGAKAEAKPTAGGPGEHGKAMKTGVDRATGKKVTQYEDGTVLDDEGNPIT